MQVVIDINDEIYNEILSGKDRWSNHVHELIRKGTPLPERHGRLIDADRLKTHFVGTEQGTDLEVYLEPTIINAPTIIEANKAESAG